MRPGEIAKLFLEFEKENDIFEWESGGIYIWQLCRVNIFQHLLAKVKNDKPTYRGSTIKRILNKRFRFKNILLYNPLRDNKHSDVLVFESSRYVNVNGKFVDPYTSFFTEALKKKNLSVTRYQSNYTTDHLTQKNSEVKHLDFIEYSALKKAKTDRFVLKNEDLTILKKIEKFFSGNLNTNLNLNPIVSYLVSFYRAELFYYKKLLDLKKPEKIFLVDYNSKMAIVTAAKERRIETTELQHGVMVGEDIIYHYPTVKEGEHKYFPDKFIVWNELWKTSCKLPIKPDNISIRKNDLLEIKKSKYASVQKNDKQILIASQYDLTNEIAKVVLNNIALLKNYKIIYKLHPVEYPELEKNVYFKKLKEYDNVVFPDSKSDLHLLLAESKYFVGVYTFVIFEAIEFDCEINLIELPGIEMMNFLKDVKKIKFHKDFEKFCSSL